MLRGTTKATTIVISGVILYIVSCAAHAEKLKSRDYSKYKETMGVVLLDANWGRWWECGGYENAQLVSFRFDVIAADETAPAEKYSSIFAKARSRLFVDPVFLNYGFLVLPGKYALTEFTIKAARSRSDVGYLVAEEEKLVGDGTYPGGTFHVSAGEVVYIGNFYLDCLESPILWRYYSERPETYDNHVAEYRRKFKFLKDAEIVYRLFETSNFGNDYEHPKAEEERPNNALH